MKAEFSVLCQYARRLVNDNVITTGDFTRIEQSLTSKGVGFIHDMACLLDDLRLGLSTGYFTLGEHSRCVFKAHSKSVLPEFLWVLFRLVFECDGTLREDMDKSSCSELMSILSLLKRTDPVKGSGPALSAKVWSTLVDNFSDYESTRAYFYA